MDTLFRTSDKSIVLKAFNKQFFDFIDELITIYPDSVEIATARDSFNALKRLNPTCIIKVWQSNIYTPYKDTIDAGDIHFFMEKDYSEDITSASVANAKGVLEMIDNVREPIKNLSDSNKAHATKYIQNLSKLSMAYSVLTAQ